MTTLEQTTHRSGGGWVIFVLVAAMLLAAGCFFAKNIKFTHHAKTSHAAQVSAIEKCFDGGGTLGPMYKTPEGRWMQHCKDQNNNLYWRVMECEGQAILIITQFKMNWRESLTRLQNYVNNKGLRERPLKC